MTSDPANSHELTQSAGEASELQAKEVQQVTYQQPQRVVVTSTKSMGISIMLTVLFGPFGMLYSTIWGAVIMGVIALVVGVLTLGIGLFIIWPICIIWGALATSSYNKRLLEGQRPY